MFLLYQIRTGPENEISIQFIKENTFYKKGQTYNKITRKKISVIIITHVFGNAAQFEELYDLCKKRKTKITGIIAIETFSNFIFL